MSELKTLRLLPELRGTVVLPASKSLSNRLLTINACLPQPVSLHNLSEADDTIVMRRGLMGFRSTIDIHGAGTAMRFLTALFATRPGERVLTGSERMLQRPIGVLVDALRQLGAEMEYVGEEGFPPLRIKGGELAGGSLTVEANISSQYISALLMIAPVMREGLSLTLAGHIASRPYIDMTLALMRDFGAIAHWTTENEIFVAPGGYQRTADYTVEADWSAASYWYELLALSPDSEARIVLPQLQRESLQGDCRTREFFEPLGVHTAFTPEGVVLTKGEATTGRLELNLSAQPDLAQTLVVTCAMLGRPFCFSGLESLRIKETDRLAALQQELRKLGCEVVVEGDSVLRCDAPQPATVATAPIATYDDHRMALAFAPCAYRCEGLAIEHPEVVAKSYPSFWDDLKKFEQQ